MSCRLLLVVTLSLEIRIFLTMAIPVKRQQSESCQQKFTKAKKCLKTMMYKMREGIDLLKQDQMSDFIEAAGTIEELKEPCIEMGSDYDQCCALESICSETAAEQAVLLAQVTALGEEWSLEINRADERRHFE